MTPPTTPLLNVAKRQLSKTWINTSNKEEVSELFSFAFYF